MEVLLYVLSLLGSCSIGYSLLRTGFPEKQDTNIVEKLGYGYALGLIVFIPGIIAMFLYSEKSFFIMAGIFYALMIAIMLVVRKSNNKKDEVELFEEKKTERIPKKAMTKEEQTAGTKIAIDDYDKPVEVVSDKEIKEQLFKVKSSNVIQKLREKTIGMEKQKKDKEKEETLKKLKGFAKQIKESSKEELKDVEEDELERIGEED